MAANGTVNWQQPIYGADVQTSQAYLQRLQEFLAAQSGSSSSGSGSVGDTNGSTSNTVNGSETSSNKRKTPADAASGSNTAGALKDRRQSGSGPNGRTANHTHDRSESPTEPTSSKKKGSTSDKRKEQNRNAQRAFRERKEKVLRDLEDKIEDLNKVNDQKSSENKNLRELVERLQEENARLQQVQSNQPPAPQSDFTFRSQPSASTAASTSTSNNNAPTSLSDQDILAFLNQPAPVFPQQPAFTMIQPSGQGSGSSTGGSTNDDWLWNASTFGTEIPQAIPLGVTNLTDPSARPQNALFPWADLNSTFGDSSASSSTSPSTAFPNAGPSPNFASFLTGYSPLTNQSTVSPPPGGQPSNGLHNQQTHRSNSGTSQSNGSSQRAGSFNSNGKAGSSQGESPETTCSSSGSDPSDNQPATPSSTAFPFVANPADGTINFAAMFGQAPGAQNGFTDSKNSPFSFANAMQSQVPVVKTESPQSATSFFGSMQATTPSGIFDALNYRDPILADLDGGKADGGVFDIADYLAPSPQSQQGAATVPSPPTFQHHSSSGSTQSGNASSTGSGLTYPRSTSSGHSSNATSPPSAGVNGQVELPYAMTYGHPLAQYAVSKMPGSFMTQGGDDSKPRWQAYADKVMANCKADLARAGYDTSAASDPDAIDSLCKDMQLKARCEDSIRKKIQESLDSDAEMMKLYNKYMEEGQLQQSPAQSQ